MGMYGSRLTKATSSTTVGFGSLSGSVTRRGRLHYLGAGSSAAPADNNIVFEIQRHTTAATGSSVTPNAFDPADVAATCVVLENLSVQGTNTAGALLLSLPCNQKASVQWYALPGGEIVVPATANTGVHFNTPTAGSTPAITAAIHHSE
jgi:hypothetical protein